MTIQWVQFSFDPDLAAQHTPDVPMQEDGTPYPADHPIDPETGTLEGWNGLMWRLRPYSEIDPNNENWVLGNAPSRVYNTDTPGQWSLYGKKADAVRTSAWMDVDEGQYEIRIRRVTKDSTADRDVSNFSLLQIKSVQPDKADYTGQKRWAMRIQASSQLNGSINNLSAVARGKIPVWTKDGWVTKHTQNPAWWYLWWLRGLRDGVGRRIYGAGFTDAEIDIDGLARWASFCDAHALTVNLVIDKQRSVYSIQQAIAACGRASPTIQTGKHGVVWAEADRPVVAIITPSNIVAGSFSINFNSSPDLTDEVIVSYIDTTTWEPTQVRVKVPGVEQIRNSVTKELEGCTDQAMAGQYANLLAASQALHRRVISWTQDIESCTISRGDIVQASHDMTSWDCSGRLIGGDRNTLRLDKPVPLAEAGGWVMVRFPDMRLHVYRVVGGEAETNVLHLVAAIPTEDDQGPLPAPNQANPIDFLWMYSVDRAVPGMRLLVTDVQPDGSGNATFTAVDDAAEYYAAANNPAEVLTAIERIKSRYSVLSIRFSTGNYNKETKQFYVSAVWTMNRDCPVSVLVTVNGEKINPVVDHGRLGFWAPNNSKVITTITPTPLVISAVSPKTANYTVVGAKDVYDGINGEGGDSSGNGVDASTDGNVMISFDSSGGVILAFNKLADPAIKLWELRIGEAGFDVSSMVAQTTDSFFKLPLTQLLGQKVWIKALYASGTYSAMTYKAAFAGAALPAITQITSRIVEPQIEFTWPAVTGADRYVTYFEEGGITTVRTVVNPVLLVGIPKYTSSLRVYAVNTLGKTSAPYDQPVGVSGAYRLNELVNIPLNMASGQYLNMAFTNANQVEKVSLLGPSSFTTPINSPNNAGLYSFGYNLQNTPGSALQNTPGEWFRQNFWYDGDGFFESAPVDLGQLLSGRLKLQVNKTVTAYGSGAGNAFAHVSGEYMAQASGLDLTDTKAFLSATFYVAPSMAGPWVEAGDGDWVESCRWVKIVVKAEHVSPLTDCLVTAGTLTLDVPDLTENGTKTAVTSAGISVPLSKSFHQISLVLLTPRGNCKAWASNVVASSGSASFTINTDSASPVDIGYFVKGF